MISGRLELESLCYFLLDIIGNLLDKGFDVKDCVDVWSLFGVLGKDLVQEAPHSLAGRADLLMWLVCDLILTLEGILLRAHVEEDDSRRP